MYSEDSKLKKIIKTIESDDYKIDVFPHVYIPAEDTYMIIDNLNIKPGSNILDLGSGTGILSVYAYKFAKRLVSIDLSPYAVENTYWNLKQNDMLRKSCIIQANYTYKLPIKHNFEIILFNPPYLPKSQEDTTDLWLRRTWSSDEGINAIYNTIKNNIDLFTNKTELYLLISTHTGPKHILNFLKKYKLSVEIIDEQSFFFEKLILLKARKL